MSQVIFTAGYTLMQPMPGSGYPVGHVFEIGDIVSDDDVIALLEAADAPVLFLAAEFGTAAYKNVSDNARTTVASVAGSTTTGNLLAANDTVGTVSDANIAANRVMTASFNNPSAGANIIVQTVSLTAAALAIGGEVIIQQSVPSGQYKVRDIKVNYSASGLSGGGGNRLIQITDGTTVFNNAGITAALLGTPINTVWGGTGNPLPGTVSADTSTTAGNNLVAKYAGGTTDYTAGSVSITVTLQRVA